MGGMARSLLAASFCLCNVAGFAPRSQPSALRHAMQTQTQMRLGDESAASEPRHQPVSARLAAFVLGGLLTLQPGAPPSSLLLPHALATPPSSATTSAGSRVNKDAESLLRYGLPIDSRETRDLQKAIELIKDDITSKRLSAASSDVNQASRLSSGKAVDKIVSAVRPEAKEDGAKLVGEINGALSPLQGYLAENNQRGSPQERIALDAAYKAQAGISLKLSQLEEMMVPSSYGVAIPDEFKDLPALKGRAIIEMVVKKDGGEKFDVEGVLYDKAVMRMVIDGYTAPLTGGNIVDLVKRGFYTNQKIVRSDGFVVQMGDPEPDNEKINGFIPAGQSKPRNVPLEIFVAGDKEPIYSSTIEEDGRGSAQTKLPFQSFGALGMAREEYDDDSASSQFFWLLFDSDLTPAGKNMLDGRYACFGYTVEGAEFLSDVKEGDIIESAKVIG